MRAMATAAQRRRGAPGVALLIAVVCLAAVAPSAVAKKPDSVIGSGTAGSGTFSVNAVSKKPTKTSGSVVFHLGIGDIVGEVTCVDVQGGLGVVSGTLVDGTTA